MVQKVHIRGTLGALDSRSTRTSRINELSGGFVLDRGEGTPAVREGPGHLREGEGGPPDERFEGSFEGRRGGGWSVGGGKRKGVSFDGKGG